MDKWTLEVELEKKQIYLEERILEKEKKFADLGSWTLEISTSWIYLGKGILEKIIYKTNIIYIIARITFAAIKIVSIQVIYRNFLLYQ